MDVAELRQTYEMRWSADTYSHHLVDEFVKTLRLPAPVIAALDNNTQGQATAGIQ
jgi:hypothetical protein